MNHTMLTADRRIRDIDTGAMDALLADLYGAEALPHQKDRYRSLLSQFADTYGGDRPTVICTVSGRSELSGNHTDHNHGCVIAASIDLDIIAVAAANEDGVMRVSSQGFGEDHVALSDTKKPNPDLYGTSASLMAGMCACFEEKGLTVGGFDACMTSDVKGGSGLSSSAAYENMLGMILSHLYNDGQVDVVEIAKMSQKAENVYFGKPCGLMDQVACAVGGIVAIDFADPSAPVIQPLPFDMTAAGYALCIVHTGGSHADLTDEYAAIPRDMKAVAAVFGKSVLREVDESDVQNALPTLRERLGDRAVLRALHFFAENRRVAEQKAALTQAINGDSQALDCFFDGVRASGRSSFCYLQNVCVSGETREQGLALALCLAEQVLGKQGAFRVHGGGFAGTIQAFVPTHMAEAFRTTMDAAFGRNACSVLHIRPVGAARVC